MKESEIITRFNGNALEHQTLMDKLEKQDAKLDKFGEKIEEIFVNIAGLPDEIFKRADERYASKTAERVIYTLVGIVCTGFVMVLWEIIKNKI